MSYKRATANKPGPSRASEEAKNFERFQRACEHLDSGRVRRAFWLFLMGAKAGDTSSQVNLGYLYDKGIGVRASRTKAVHWYRRAYKKGDPVAANNIATIKRDQGRLSEAIRWFNRAIDGGLTDSALELGQIYVRLNQLGEASQQFRRVTRSRSASPYDRERAAYELAALRKLTAHKRKR